jgi:hypothetical protein
LAACATDEIGAETATETKKMSAMAEAENGRETAEAG